MKSSSHSLCRTPFFFQITCSLCYLASSLTSFNLTSPRPQSIFSLSTLKCLPSSTAANCYAASPVDSRTSTAQSSTPLRSNTPQSPSRTAPLSWPADHPSNRAPYRHLPLPRFRSSGFATPHLLKSQPGRLQPSPIPTDDQIRLWRSTCAQSYKLPPNHQNLSRNSRPELCAVW